VRWRQPSARGHVEHALVRGGVGGGKRHVHAQLLEREQRPARGHAGAGEQGARQGQVACWHGAQGWKAQGSGALPARHPWAMSMGLAELCCLDTVGAQANANSFSIWVVVDRMGSAAQPGRVGMGIRKAGLSSVNSIQ